MERILAMSLVGAAPGNVFGPGMSAAALETFAPRGSRKAGGGGAGGRSGSAGGATPAARDWLESSDGRTSAAAAAAAAAKGGSNGQREGSGADESARLEPASGGMYMYLFEAVAPY
ncbi:hypothetical protein ACP4OV_017179 [Aristida adscensionis]